MEKMEENAPNFLLELPFKLRFLLKLENLANPFEILAYEQEKLFKLGLTEEEIQTLKFTLSKQVFKGFFKPAEVFLSMLHKWDRLSFGCSALDAITKGGIQRLGITEICGEAGTAKSQICLQLAINVQLKKDYGGFSKSAIYICTESPFPTSRLTQIIKFIKKKYSSPEIDSMDFTSNIFIKTTLNLNDLLDCVAIDIPKLLEQHKIGLIVIDSIGAIFRTELETIERTINMRLLAHNLISIANNHECAVVCCNQMTCAIDESYSIPSLGLVWSNLLRTRIILARNRDDNQSKIIRQMEICFAPDLPTKTAYFQITSDGVVDI